jgi:VWFA-related protein
MRVDHLALATAALAVSVSAQQTSQVPGTFRSTVQLVPVDVRVFDRNGNPVLDLAESDFTLLEDGVPQQIRHFSSYALQADKSLEPGAKKMRRDAVATELSPQRRRTFLIVLGRGRLQGPSKGIEAALGFLRTRVLPQDEVSVMAYNRATDFST